MRSFESSAVRQSVSASLLDQVYCLLMRMADELRAETHIVNEKHLTRDETASLQDTDRFFLLVSESFSVLLLANAIQSIDNKSRPDDRSAYWLTLTFNPEHIAQWLSTRAQHINGNPVFQQLKKQNLAFLKPNDVNLQSDFTLRLIGCLAHDPKPSKLTETDDHQRILRMPMTIQNPCSGAESDFTSEPTPHELARLEHPHSFLNEDIIERTQELKDAMLAAEAANRAKSKFLSAMSHELRTPLTYIIGMSATLMRWSFDELNSLSQQQQQGYLQTIHDRGEHLLDLINNILDLSQLESGKAILNLQEFSLSQLAQQSLKDCKVSAEEKQIDHQLDLRIEPNCDHFVADPRRIRQILLNLLNNAIKFTPENGSLSLSVIANEKECIFRVKDTGIGIADQQRALIFQKFQQLDSSYQRQYEGAGLGLALTKQLVELHGGRIDFDSTPGIGTIFTVSIPRRSSTLDQPRSVANTEIDPRFLRSSIVLIEHHEESAHLISDMLTANGYQLIWIVDGSTALDQIDILQPAIVIAAMQLPDISGIKLIHLLRQNPSTKRLKIIALAEAHILEDRDLAKRAGADDLLLKPIKPDELLQKIDQLTVQSCN